MNRPPPSHPTLGDLMHQIAVWRAKVLHEIEEFEAQERQYVNNPDWGKF